MSAPNPQPPADNQEPQSFASRNAGAIIAIVALGLIIFATAWSLLRGP